ncbi:MAG: alpha/beta hydrolase [Alphaproteobacteria bacterium]|nr:alpha/beta hydrolase [Alphaproteobacteria bacterium]
MAETLAALPLPDGIRSRFIKGINGLRMHVLEAGHETPGRPVVVLLHGFPELAFSWRKVMPALAAAGFHVLAPDQRGYGRTSGSDVTYDDDLAPFRLMNLVRDVVGLVRAFGLPSVHAVVGHDFGASVAVWCTIARPDIFRSMVIMSAPFGGGPRVPFDTAAEGGSEPVADPVHAALAQLDRPRKHYQWYYSTRPAADEMTHPPQGVHSFMRAYYHHKSADWAANKPHPLAAWSAPELARMPTYYIMDLDETMPETVAHEMPGEAEIAANTWLTKAEMSIYAQEFARTGFQASLNWYRCRTTGKYNGELEVFDGRTVDVPSCFIAGRSDWGVYQKAGEFEKMQASAFTDMRGCHLIEGAGHWVQQEQPQETNRLLLAFLEETR